MVFHPSLAPFMARCCQGCRIASVFIGALHGGVVGLLWCHPFGADGADLELRHPADGVEGIVRQPVNRLVAAPVERDKHRARMDVRRHLGGDLQRPAPRGQADAVALAQAKLLGQVRVWPGPGHGQNSPCASCRRG